ncbi:MAG: biotin carboxylase N-terminal domain-containing protein [Pseudomonadota bacterium]|nr:biotin carboxylase N-terminal domain-containing protein [Pseudomonadota bacterium]
MLKKILIANRGEIACRVMRTASKLGVKTVAVYSDADRYAPHVSGADEAYHIGRSPSSESYLRGDKIIEVAKKCGAEGIHPGYGFLSENAEFARACTEAGIAFIGPDAESMDAMASKSAAKALMEEANVPVLEGYHGDDQSPAHLKSVADKIGYPVLIKAVAGGGGRGMRQVFEASEFERELDSARREAESGFGNPDVLIEKYLVKPRHIEVQIFGDSHGKVVHLFERDCSVQRRHQKVLEEAPAPCLDVEVRKQLLEAAVRAGEAVNYKGAGTVEFLLDGEGPDAKFYFMEMNTRLQVEHPVSEYVTGLDFVEWQLRVASGEPIPLKQDEITCTGHAIEARLCAENVEEGFLPSSGTLKVWHMPEETENLRVDTGVEQGGEISSFYDSMIAKVITYGETRDEACDTLSKALEEGIVMGLPTNLGFLNACVNHPVFRQGGFGTSFLTKEAADVLPSVISEPSEKHLNAAAFMIGKANAKVQEERMGSHNPWANVVGLRLNLPKSEKVTIGGKSIAVPTEKPEGYAWQDAKRIVAVADGTYISMPYRSEPVAEGTVQASEGALTASIPGQVTKVMAKAGEAVSKDQALMVMEAMKMEHTMRAPEDGIIEEVHYNVGDKVDDGDVLISFVDKKEKAA